MSILSTDFAAALVINAQVLADHGAAQDLLQAAKAGRVALRQAIASWGIHDAQDPFTVALVEHNGQVYRVTPLDIVQLVPEVTTT